jgi:peptide/nickel transport system substrate-binding protein
VTYRGRRPGWRRGLVLCGVAVAFVLSGCSSPGGTTTTVTYVSVAGGTISFGTNQGPTGCNPHTPTGDSAATRMVLAAVLPSPFLVDSTGSVAPNPNLILQSELVSTKPETIVYTLNPKAVWSDGVPITARDFIYAWQQQRADAPDDPNSVASVEGYRDIRSVKGSDKGRTVTVVFHTLFADWQMLFADLLPAHIMETVGWNPQCPSVSAAIDLSGGPFEITSVSAQAIGLGVNPKWWGTAPNVKGVTVHIAASTEELAQWAQSGFVQVSLTDSFTPGYLSQVSSLAGEQSEVDQSATFLQLEMASGADSATPADVRQAIALSVDRQALVTQRVNWALPGEAVSTSHIEIDGQAGYHGPPSADTPPTVPTSTTTSTTTIGQGGSVNFPITPVLDQASALMEAANYLRAGSQPWESVLGVPLTLRLAYDESDVWATATAPQLQAQLQSAGFDITLVPEATAGATGAALSSGSADLALLPRTSTPFLSQALAWYTTLLGAPGVDGSQDWTNYSDSTFNQLVTTAAHQLNPNTAATDYVAADAQLWADMVALPLFVEPTALVWSRTVSGITPTPTSDSLLWYAQTWAIRVPEITGSTTPTIPNQ